MPEAAAAGLAGDGAEVLPSLLDALIPPDETPSATQLGIPAKILALAQGIPNYPVMLGEGARWLNQMAGQGHGRPFIQLKGPEQDAILDKAFSSPAGTLPHVYLHRIREDAMRLYYQDPRSWRGTGISRPLQPLGYPGHDRPPLPR
jgi:hypothetical protein